MLLLRLVALTLALALACLGLLGTPVAATPTTATPVGCALALALLLVTLFSILGGLCGYIGRGRGRLSRRRLGSLSGRLCWQNGHFRRRGLNRFGDFHWLGGCGLGLVPGGGRFWSFRGKRTQQRRRRGAPATQPFRAGGRRGRRYG